MFDLSGLFDDPGGPLVALLIIAFLVSLVVAGFFLVRLLLKFRLVHHHLMPLGGRLAFWAAVAYTVLPLDVLPDPLLLDDIGVLALAVAYINHLASSRRPADELDDGLGQPPSTR
jgi:uncharacterized membrane protein YkvA (DUF1232 family)